MKFEFVDDISRLYLLKGDNTTDEDIDNFAKFIWREAERRGLTIRKEVRNIEDRSVERDNGKNVQSNGV
jgi:hypothetical protein